MRNPTELQGAILSSDTLRLQDLILKGLGFLNDIDAPEAVGYLLSNIPPAHAMEDEDAQWWIDEAPHVWEAMAETLNDYSPTGYTFSAHPDDGACFGWWPDDVRALDEIDHAEAYPETDGGAARPQQEGRPVREGDW